MKKHTLAAIMGAVAAYIQQEEASRAASDIGMGAWRLMGQRELMRPRTNAGVARPHPGKGLWRYSRLEESMVARARWRITKAAS